MILLAGLFLFGLCVSCISGCIALLSGLGWLYSYKHRWDWYCGVIVHLLWGAVSCLGFTYCLSHLLGMSL